MPFETGVTPFTGDNDMADFMTNVWLPFARDDCGWADNQAPTLSPEVVSPEFEVWTHRVARTGSPGAPVSPFTPQPPYVFYRSDTSGDHMNVFTGFGVNTAEEAYDQPNNPMNNPITSDWNWATNMKTARCLCMNELQGTFQAYWMFCDTSGRYIHCVIKQSNRQYRHFHVGLLTPLHPDLDPDAFYVTSHWWDVLDPGARTMDIGGTPPANGEHEPYSSNHRLPFQNNGQGNELDNSASQRVQAKGNIFYMPGLAQNSPEIVWYHAMPGDGLTVQSELAIAVRKTFGSVNQATDSVIFGVAQITGYNKGLGTFLYSCDRSFTSNAVPLIPIYVSANVDFASLNRQGVVAQIPDVFRINMQNLSPEQEITVGADTYVVFPMINNDSANVLAGEGYSAYEGLAYKKITGTLET